MALVWPPSLVELVPLTERAVAALTGFDIELELSPEALSMAIERHPLVRVADDPAAYPPPPLGAPLLAYRLQGGRIGLRHYAGPLDLASPCLVLDAEATGHGCRVRGRLVRHDPTLVASYDAHWVMRSLLALLGATVAIPLVLMWTSLGAGAIGLITATVLHVGILVISLGARLRRDGPVLTLPSWWSRPTTRQIARYGPRMWSVLSEAVYRHRRDAPPERVEPYRSLPPAHTGPGQPT